MKNLLRVIFVALTINQEIVQCASFIKILPVTRKFNFEMQPFKSFSFLIENLPFGKFELKHSIEKRETENVSPEVNEIPVVPIEEQKVPVQTVVVSEPISTPPLKTDEVPRTFSVILPWNPDFMISPTQEPVPANEPPVFLEPVSPEPVPVVPVVEITPKPVELVLTPVKTEPVAAVVTPVVESLPPLEQVPVFKTEVVPNPLPVPVFNNGELKITPLITDITKLPIYNLSPAYPVPIISPPITPILQEVVAVPATPLPPPPPPPPLPVPPKEETPVLAPPKVEYPSYLVKGSRLMLFFGTKILRMLSKFIEGGVSQISNMPSFPITAE